MAATVELFYADAWNDVSDDVRAEDGISILRGRPAPNRRTRPTECRLSLNNHDGKYSPRNPESELYGLIGRNTPIRVYVDTDETVTEGFEDASLDITIDDDSGAWARSTTLGGHTGSWALFSEAVLDTDTLTITVPAGATSISFWARSGTITSGHTMAVEVDGVEVHAAATLTTSYVEFTFDVTDASTVTIFHAVPGGSNRNMAIDDITFSDFRSYRFYGEVEAWPVRTQGQGKDVYSPIRAYGVTRRMGAGGSVAPALSAMRRYIESQTPAGYWPMDTRVSLTGGAPMVAKASDSGGDVVQDWATATVAGWLEPGAHLPPRRLVGPSTAIAEPTAATIDMVAWGQLVAASAGSWGLMVTDRGESTIAAVFASWVTGTPTLSLFGSGGPALDTGSATDAAKAWDGAPHHWRITVAEDGSDLDVTVYIDGVEVMSGTDSSKSLSTVKPILFTNDGVQAAVGHVVQWSGTAPSVTDAAEAALGYAAEEAHDRLDRLGDEENITVTVTGDDSAAMGPQGVDSVLELMHEAADTDGGVLVESRSTAGLDYRTHTSLVNDAAAATLDYDDREVWRLDPTEDTDVLANAVTVRRRDGGESTVEVDDGTLGTDTVGRYPQRVELNLATDSQTLQQAAWRAHVGTWDEPRYANLAVNVAGLLADGEDALVDALLDTDVGDLVLVVNPPEWAQADTIGIIVDGYREEIGSHTHTIEFAGAPGRPYQVGALGTARLDVPDGTTIDEDLTTTETGVTVSDAVFSSASVPYTVVVGGERMTVTAVSGTTLTVTRSANGVVKTHSSGDAIHIAAPMRLARGA